jgi:hypothetical protein
MTGGPGTGSAQVAANKAAELERTYAGIETRLKKVGETLGETWSGASADAAQAAGNPINQAMIQMQDALRQADHSLSNQVYQFNYNKGQLKNMPESKPDTGFWDDVSPWDTDAEDAVNQYNSEESHNRKVYSEFQSASNTNRGELPKEFPGVMADSLNVEVITSNESGGDKTANIGTAGRPNGTTGTGFPNTTGSPQGPTGGWTGPGGINGDLTTTTTSAAVGEGRTGAPMPGDLPGAGKPPAGSVIERPPNTGIPPIGVPGGPGLNGPGGTGRGPGGGNAAGKLGGGGAGKLGGGAGSGRFGGGGLGGSGLGGSGLGGTGTGSGTSAQQPGGKSGVFGAMGEHGPNAGARGGAAGAAGRGGAAGMGGMGGAGQKGQGEDDLEHKSADYLVTEENTNEIIGDMPMVAPPTIGG